MPIEAVEDVEAGRGGSVATEAELWMLGLQNLDERVAPVAARVMDGHAGGLAHREEIRLDCEQRDWCGRHARLDAVNGVNEPIAALETVAGRCRFAIQSQPTGGSGRFNVLGVALRKLLREHLEHGAPNPAAFCKRGEGVLVRFDAPAG